MFIKKYLFNLFPIILLLLVILFYPKVMQPDYQDLVKLSGFSEPAYGVVWYEPRYRVFQKAIYEPYPEMPSCDRLRFVYKLSPSKIKNATK